MDNVLTLVLWLLPVTGVLALSAQEYMEEKVFEQRGRKIGWDQLFPLHDMLRTICQNEICGCETDFTESECDDSTNVSKPTTDEELVTTD
jgi:hypothetical protein